MSSKGKGRKTSKAVAPAAATIIVVILLAHSLASGSAMWFLAGALFLVVIGARRMFFARGRSRRGARGLRYRRRLHVLPFVWLNISRSPSKGWSHSWSVKIGPWSRNSRTPGKDRVDLPGGFHWQ